ncbi:MAG: hypothetical protein ABMA15_25100 [Vicinamibacterales bacterium]
MNPQLVERKKKDEDIVVHVLGNLYRVVDNPVEDPVDGVVAPLWYVEPVTEEQAATRPGVKASPGKPWTLYRILLTLFYAHGQIEDVDKLNKMSRLRKRIRDAESNQIEVVRDDIKFIRELTKKLADAKRMPIACWEVLEEELTRAESTSAKEEEEVAPSAEPAPAGTQE